MDDATHADGVPVVSLLFRFRSICVSLCLPFSLPAPVDAPLSVSLPSSASLLSLPITFNCTHWHTQSPIRNRYVSSIFFYLGELREYAEGIFFSSNGDSNSNGINLSYMKWNWIDRSVQIMVGFVLRWQSESKWFGATNFDQVLLRFSRNEENLPIDIYSVLAKLVDDFECVIDIVQ